METTTTPTPAATDWAPYTPDPAKSAQENLVLKEAHDKTAPAGHDVNTPFKAPAPAAPAPAAPAPNAAPAPLAFTDITVPEGYQMDEGLGTELLTIINNPQLSPKDRMNELIKLNVKAQERAREIEAGEWDNTLKSWQKEMEADPEIGGANYSKATATAKQLQDRFGGAELQEMLTLTGVGSHKAFVRFLNKLAPFVSEASPVPVPTPAPAADRPTSTNLYPSQGK